MTTTEMAQFVRRAYLPVIEQFPDVGTQDSLLKASVHTVLCLPDPSQTTPGTAPIALKLPREFEFVGNELCDLGFNKYELPQAELDKVYLAFCTDGVAVPNTPYKLRHSVMSLFTFVEPASGNDVALPTDWRQFVRSPVWIGKKVVARTVDLSLYQDEGDGYLLQKRSDG